MKKLLVLIILINLSGCKSEEKSVKQKNIVTYNCECVNLITDDKNTQESITAIQECISKGNEEYSEYLENLAIKYLDKNPSAPVEQAQNWVTTWLTKKMVERCPRYSKIVSEFAFQNRNDSEIIKKVASKICEEINSLKSSELSWAQIDPIFIKQTTMNNLAITNIYNLNDKKEMNEYSTDLVQELVATCDKYKDFTIKMKR